MVCLLVSVGLLRECSFKQSAGAEQRQFACFARWLVERLRQRLPRHESPIPQSRGRLRVSHVEQLPLAAERRPLRGRLAEAALLHQLCVCCAAAWRELGFLVSVFWLDAVTSQAQWPEAQAGADP